MDKKRIQAIRNNSCKTMIWILGFEGETKVKITAHILEHGIKDFLIHHQEMDLQPEEHEKIDVLKRVIQTFDGDIEAINFGDMNDGC